MGDKKKAIEELKKQISGAKQRLGPDGVKELENLAKGMKKPKAPEKKLPPGMVPYDKESAMKAFKMFLANHGDPKEFEKKLLEMLKKQSH